MDEKKTAEKMKIGYLLADFRDADVAFFRGQLLTQYDRRAFALYCYVYGERMEIFRPWQDGESRWLHIAALDADLAAQAIRRDGPDILVDLSGCRTERAAEILARRPAKLQVGFVGAFSSYRLKSVAYLLTDKYCDPPDQKERYFTEQLYWLPQTHFCYAPPQADDKAARGARRKSDGVTFGSFHHFTQLSDAFLALWGNILQALPTARLVLESRIFGSGYGCQETRYRLRRLGFPVERVSLRAPGANLARYGDVDILLDTYPRQAAQHICDVLYMGTVPVALAGKRHHLRLSYALLKNAGLEECVAFDEASYVQRAIALASNPYRLRQLQKNLRQRLLKSPLADARRFVGNVERAYREMQRMQQEEARLPRVRAEVFSLLESAEEGLLYIAARLDAAQDSAMVGRIVGDLQQAFRRLAALPGRAPQLAACRLPAAELLDGAADLRRFYARREYGRACAVVEQTLLPRVRALALRLQDDTAEKQ